MVSFQRKTLQLKNIYILQLFVKKFIVHSLSASYEREILEWKKNYAHVLFGPTEHGQGVV